MTTPDALLLSPLSAYTWPVTYTYRLLTPWGGSQQVMTVNVPALQGDVEATKRLGLSLWGKIVAGATSFLVKLESYEVRCWRPDTLDFVAPSLPTYGMQPRIPAGRASTPAVQLLSGYNDGLSIRRFPFVGAPAAWVDGGLLTEDGRRVIENTAQAMMMGLNMPETGGPLTWLIVYRDVPAGDTEPAIGLAFRRVEYVRVLHHTLRAPEPSLPL